MNTTCTKLQLREILENTLYATDEGGYTMARENDTITPNGNLMNGQWVLRRRGNVVDFDKYRYDLAERNRMEIVFDPNKGKV